MVDTQQQMVPVPLAGVRAPSKRHRVWSVPLAAIGVGTIALVLAAWAIPAKLLVDKRDCVKVEEVDGANVCTARGPSEDVEYAQAPADAQSVESRLSISGFDTYGSTGQIYFVTVSTTPVQLIDWFVARHNPATRLGSREDFYGSKTDEQSRTEGFAQMRDAKQVATFVALERAGFPVKLIDGLPTIASLCLDGSFADKETCTDKAPAADVLEPGDVFTKIDDTTVTTLDELSAAVQTHAVGDVVTVEVSRSGKKLTFPIELIEAQDDGPTRPILGFLPADTRNLEWCDDDGCSTELPADLKIDFDTEGIGGPSAGTAFTIALIDELTPGSLMGTQTVAITGTIDIDGNVGAIGGLPSKTSAVKQTGVKYFIVPEAQGEQNLAEARKVAGNDVQLIPVKTIDDVIAFLATLGGDELPTPDTVPATVP